MLDPREQLIIEFIKNRGACSSKEVHENVNIPISYATLKRVLSKLITNNYLLAIGKGKGTKYIVSPTFELLMPIDIEKYFELEIDERAIKEDFNFSIINEVLAKQSVFTENELEKLRQ
jgi:predicted transcriptional regulator